jgi:hypothetical protein
MAQEQATARQRHVAHEHTKRCYWDFLECQWVCRLDEAAVAVSVEAVPVEAAATPAVPLAASAAEA